jgi:hypothetical protein
MIDLADNQHLSGRIGNKKAKQVVEERTKKILEFLEPAGTGEYSNISPLLNDFFPLTDHFDYAQVTQLSQRVWDFVYGLNRAKLIRLRDNTARKIGDGNRTNGFIWLDTITIEAAIDPEGEIKLAEERAKKEENEIKHSTLVTNIAIQRLSNLTETSINSQTRLTKVALWIAAASAFITLVALFKDCLKADKPQIIQLQVTDSIFRSIEKRTKDEKPISQSPLPPKKISKSGNDTITGKP